MMMMKKFYGFVIKLSVCVFVGDKKQFFFVVNAACQESLLVCGSVMVLKGKICTEKKTIFGWINFWV